MRPLAIASALLVAACAAPTTRIEPLRLDAQGAEPVFLHDAGGWTLSAARPVFPITERWPALKGLSGAATAAPFGCGLADVHGDYFSGDRGRLACVSRGPDGRLRLIRPADRMEYSRIYDAAPADGGYVVVARPYRKRFARITTLSADGAVLRSIDLPDTDDRSSPDQIVILPTGRIVVLVRSAGTCEWRVLERGGDGFTQVSTTPADHAFQCQTQNHGGGGVIRDQATGQTWLRQFYPDKNALYRLDDNTAQGRGPATLVVRDMAALLPMDVGSQPALVSVLDGALYFEAPSVSGPIVVRYDIAAEKLSRTDLRAASGRWRDAGRVQGLMLTGKAGDRMQVAVMTPSSAIEVLPVAQD
ncbi:hypothetical protein [Brevundimonas goettingensis]|uniref:Uncharacterized protein n=1 Tax=Brevundimonas goettingensis TaxID=2774190 RepID=A0A975C5Z6_9CAUL|nr:hypothetical protein [Brevundimonas goettingensis]QTC92595.1 hypothetical protein IFJ75_06930 [Brevundimonas goettingensis]